MNIVTLAILLICAVTKISTKWTTSQALMEKIDALRSALEERDANDDIRILLDNNSGKVMTLDHFPLQEILTDKGISLAENHGNRYYNQNHQNKLMKSRKPKKNHHKIKNEYHNFQNIDSGLPEIIDLDSYGGSVPLIYEDFEKEKNVFIQQNPNERDDDTVAIEKIVVMDVPIDSDDGNLLDTYNNRPRGYQSSKKNHHEYGPIRKIVVKQLEEQESNSDAPYRALEDNPFNTKDNQRKAKYGAQKQRFKRDTQAGYTQDPDTCKQYNENLEKMWATLSKHINTTETVNVEALHNIAVMVQAYLDHKKKHPTEEVITRQEIKRDKISVVLKKIKKFLGKDDALEKVKEMVLENFKPDYEPEDPDCKQTNEDTIFSSIALSYKNYLDNAKCHGDYDTGLLRGKALLRGGPPHNPKSVSNRQFRDSYVVDNSIVDESSEEFNRRRISLNKRSKMSEGFNHKIYHPRLNREAVLRKGRSSSSKLSAKQKKKSAKKKSRSRKKTRVRTDESCVNYANRKFLITLRSSIERFMNLRDCQHDDTLRTSNNKKRKSVKRKQEKVVLPKSNKHYVNNMRVMTNTKVDRKKQRQNIDYLSKFDESKDQNSAKKNKTVFILFGNSYLSPLLLKFQNEVTLKRGQTKRPFDPITRSGYYSNNVFLNSSETESQNSLSPKKNRDGEVLKGNHNINEVNNFNSYDLTKHKFVSNGTNPLTGIDDDAKAVPSDNADINGANINDDEDKDGSRVNFASVDNILNEVLNSSLQKKQIDVSALANETGYVELSYLVKYHKSIVYRPQYLVKNILQYDDFIKIANQLYATDNDKQLVKIVRYLPDNTTQLLFETQDFKSILELYDIEDNKRQPQPIFPQNNSSFVDVLRQHVTNETNEYDTNNENEPDIGITSLLKNPKQNNDLQGDLPVININNDTSTASIETEGEIRLTGSFTTNVNYNDSSLSSLEKSDLN